MRSKIRSRPLVSTDRRNNHHHHESLPSLYDTPRRTMDDSPSIALPTDSAFCYGCYLSTWYQLTG
jgi:hypothetical protein